MSLEYERIETELPGKPKQQKQILIKSREAAKLLAISPRTLWKLTNCGKIPCFRIGVTIRYAVNDLEQLVKNHTK